MEKSYLFSIIGLLFFALSFFLVGGSENKLIVGGLIMIYLGLVSLFDDGENSKDLSKYLGVLFITLGSIALLTSYLLPENLNWFAFIVLTIIFVEWIFLDFFGPKMWFRNLLFVMFILPVSVTIWSIMSDSFRIGISQLASANWVLIFFSIIILTLIYNTLTTFFSKLWPKSKKLKKMSSTRSSIIFVIILIVISGVGFYYGNLGLNEIYNFLTHPVVVIISFIALIVSWL